MARAFRISAAAAAAMLGDGSSLGLGGLLSGGTLRIYDGSAPASCDDPVGSVTTLVEFTLPAPAFTAASGNVLTAVGLSSSVGLAFATATWWRALTGLVDPVCQGTAGETADDTDLTLDHKAITIGSIVAITDWTITQGMG
jgi:hypothetical protein